MLTRKEQDMIITYRRDRRSYVEIAICISEQRNEDPYLDLAEEIKGFLRQRYCL